MYIDKYIQVHRISNFVKQLQGTNIVPEAVIKLSWSVIQANILHLFLCFFKAKASNATLTYLIQQGAAQ